MSETTNMGNAFFKNDDVANIESIDLTTETIKKPYELRGLCGDDVFPLLNIIRKIGLNEIRSCINDDTIKNAIGSVMDFINRKGTKAPTEGNETEGDVIPSPAEENAENDTTEGNETLVALGLSILPTVLDVADVILGNISKCRNEVHEFLSNISNLSVEEVKHLPLPDFAEMIIDVVKKDEFKDFFKVVSKLFK